MRTRITTCVVAIAFAVLHAFAAGAAQPQPIATERIADVTLRVLVEGGKLLVGANDIVLELRPATEPPDVSDVILTAARPGAPSGESVTVDLSPVGAGRFFGTLKLPWTDNCRLEVAWHDQHGHHTHDFVVPVVAGHH
jgi:hypothetical protein